MASSISSGRPSDLRVPAEAAITPALARVLQSGWAMLQLGAFALAAAATPSMHALYQTACADQICDLLPQPNQGSIDLLGWLGIALRDYATAMLALEWSYGLLAATIGAVVVLKRPRDPVALLLAYFFSIASVSTFLRVLPDAYPDFTFPSQLTMFLLTGLAIPVFARFPDGRWVPHWAALAAIAVVPFAALVAFGAGEWPQLVSTIEMPVFLGVWGFVLAAQVYRYRSVSDAIHRQQSKWLLFAVGMFVLNVAIVLIAYALGVLQSYQFLVLALCYGAGAGMLLAIGFAILRYRLFDIDVIVNRTLVYGGMTIAILLIYVLVVSGVGSLIQVEGHAALSILATGLAAVLFQPMRLRLQRLANRMIYGDRDDPYQALTNLGHRLEASLVPEEVFPTIVETVAQTLKLPYVALTVGHDHESPAAHFGVRSSPELTAIPLNYHASPVGSLHLEPRAGERALSGPDLRLLGDLARQAGVAIHAAQLTLDIQRARHELLVAREEERRRLRRDLHDGLGPSLASQALTIDAASLLVQRDPERAVALLEEARQQSRAAVAEIRRVVYQLRPPALDDLGLVGALRAQQESLAEAGIILEIQGPDPFPSLPAAVEVAAFRIAQEALANVSRHAGPCRCIIAFSAGASLVIEITDDGAGFSHDRRSGVGLASMRERSEELGGTLTIESTPGAGTSIRAMLPIERQEIDGINRDSDR